MWKKIFENSNTPKATGVAAPQAATSEPTARTAGPRKATTQAPNARPSETAATVQPALPSVRGKQWDSHSFFSVPDTAAADARTSHTVLPSVRDAQGAGHNLSYFPAPETTAADARIEDWLLQPRGSA